MSGFDSVAGIYRWLEYAAHGRGLERVRFHHLSRLASCRSLLIVGEGDGRFLARLLATVPGARVHCIDASANMIERASSRLDAAARSRVTFEHADIRTVTPSAAAYDAVVTLFVLDCFVPDELQRVAARLNASLSPGGLWLFADYALPEGGWQRARARVWLRVLYTFFGITAGLEPRALPPSESILTSLGLRIDDAATFDHGLLRAVLFRKPAAPTA